jgi:hypothetical protein
MADASILPPSMLITAGERDIARGGRGYPGIFNPTPPRSAPVPRDACTTAAAIGDSGSPGSAAGRLRCGARRACNGATGQALLNLKAMNF